MTIAGFSSVALADNIELPNQMNAQTKIEQGSRLFYTGMNANEIIVNTDVNTELGYRENTLNKDWKNTPPADGVCYTNTINTMIVPPPYYHALGDPRCFFLTNTAQMTKNMTSHTYVNGTTGLEFSILLYPANTVSGDTSSGASDLSNFAMNGRNFAMSANGGSIPANSTWKQTNYSINPQAQSSYSPDQEVYIDKHIENLWGEAEPKNESFIRSNDWNFDTDPSYATQPEGVVWKVPTGADATITLGSVGRKTYTFSGTGTIIIDGDLNIQSSVSIIPRNNDSKLGIIVKGRIVGGVESNNNLTIHQGANIKAAMLVKGNFDITGSGNVLTGSFVSKTIDFHDTISQDIQYDYRLEDAWPPGFRYFNMPQAGSTAP